MAILNKIIDGLVGVPSMRRTRDFRMEAINSMYDPTIYNEIATRQRTKATEGLSNLVEQDALRRTSDQMNRPIDYSMTGGNAARAMSMANMQQIQGNKAHSEMATQLAQMDEQVRNQYGDAYTETVANQGQIAGQRRAGLASEQASFNEERSMRRMALGANVAQMGFGAVMGAATGGLSLGGFLSSLKAKRSLTEAKAAGMPTAPEAQYLDMEPDLSTNNVDYGSMQMSMPQAPTTFQAPPSYLQPTGFPFTPPPSSGGINFGQFNDWTKPVGQLRGGPTRGNRFMQAPGILPLNFY